jgi:Tol biopolymer transport system component
VRLLSLLLLAASVALAAGGASAAEAPVTQIFSAHPDGEDARSLTGPEEAAGGALPAPGGRIAFVRGVFGDAATRWLMNEDGSVQRQLPVAPTDGYFGPAWAPDGRTLAVTRWDDSPCTPSSRNCAISELVLFDVESGAERRVLRSRGRGIGDFSWSPDGTRLAYAGELNMDLGGHTIETVRSDGTGRRVVLRLLPRGSFPGFSQVTWSPKGDRIAYARGASIWLVRPQGGAGTRLVSGHTPVWSPRGDRLLFVSPREDSVSVVDVATRRVRVLARGPEASLPRWSPDGRRVVLETRVRGVSTLSVVRLSDGRRLHAWRPGGDVTSLFFTRDGSRLVYTRLGS